MEHIRDIRLKHGLDLNCTDEQAIAAVRSLKSNLANALRNLSEELYTKTTHFVLEFIQNADDNSYAIGVTPTLEIQLKTRDRTIDIRCNETGFTTENVDALCSVGKSTKKYQQGYIGEKGIGFKSVFTIADVVEVISGGYTFRFDKTQELGMIAPIWLAAHAGTAREKWTTFRLHISAGVDIENLSNKLREIEPTLLLFLRKLRLLQVSIDNVPRQFSRLDGMDTMTTLKSDNKADDYLVVRQSVATYRGEEKRPGILTSEIVLAFPVGPNGEPAMRKQNVHTFLPLRSYGLKFILQADFLTTSSREDILTDSAWNMKLRDAVAPLFCHAITQFNTRPNLHYNWPQYVPCNSTDDFMKPVVNGIKSSARLLGQDGSTYRADELLIVPLQYRTLSGDPLVPERYVLHSRYLSQGYNTSRDAIVFRHLGVKTMGPDEFIHALQNMNQSSSRVFAQQSEEWFERTSKVLRDSLSPNVRLKIVKALNIIPLADGSWVSSAAPNIFFDAALDDIPTDLDVYFVRRLEPTSSHRRLLEDLGIKKAIASHIVDKILDKHRGPAASLAHSMLLVHAKFLFKHSTHHYLSNIKVLCRNNHICPANTVYIDLPENLPELQPSVLLGPHDALLLHRSYYDAVPSECRSRWFDWLRQPGGICTFPRVTGGQLLPEFSSFVQSAPTSTLLAALRHYWEKLSSCIYDSSKAQNDLSALQVRCTDGVSRKLADTYLARPALRQFADLPFLDVKDPESKSWDFLSTFGVTMNLNCAFYLRKLIEFSAQAPTERTEETVAELYQQLQARFDDDSYESAIRQAFRNHPLIYVPPGSRFTMLHPGVHWVSCEQAHWNGPTKVSSKLILNTIEMYHPVQKFFTQQLSLSCCANNILLDNLRAVTKSLQGHPLNSAEHEWVFECLVEINDAVRASSSRRGKAEHNPQLGWLDSLRDLPICPAAMPSGEVRLCKIGDVYHAYGSGGLEDLFKGRTPLFKAPETTSFYRIRELLKSRAFDELKHLGECVDKQLIYSKNPRLDVLASKEYSPRLRFIKRLSLSKSGTTSRIATATDLVVYEVNELSCEYTLDSIRCSLPMLAAVEVRGERITLLRSTTCPPDQGPPELARAISEELCLEVADILLLFLPGVPDVAIQMSLKSKGIPELENLEEESHADTSWMSQVSGISTKQMLLSTPNVPSTPKRRKNARRGAASVDFDTPAYETELTDFLNQYEPALRKAGANINDVLATGMPSLDERFEGLSLEVGFGIDGALSSHDTTHIGHRRMSSASASTFKGSPKLAPKRRDGLGRQNGATMPSAGASFAVADSQPTVDGFMNGILGEHFIYMLFSDNLPDFNEDNWTSELREHVPGFEPYTEDSLADFVYHDSTGSLTELVFKDQTRIIEGWRGSWPTFYLEVKSTSGARSAPFDISRRQVQLASSMTIQDPDNPPANVYVLIRVWNVRSDVRCKAYPDPHRLLYDGGIEIVSDCRWSCENNVSSR